MIGIPEKVKEITGEHIDRLESNLPDFLDSYYVYGSVSLGAFDYGFSDIDFFAVVKREVTDADINILKKIHNDMKRKFRKTILDGMYVAKDDLLALSKKECPCLRFNEGKFFGFRKFHRNSIDAYQLKKYGIK